MPARALLKARQRRPCAAYSSAIGRRTPMPPWNWNRAHEQPGCALNGLPAPTKVPVSIARAVRRAIRFAWSASLLALGRLPYATISSYRPERTPPAPAAQVTTDASYDWHGLLIAPFGSVLKDISGQAASRGVAVSGSGAGRRRGDNASSCRCAECHAIDAPAPRFVGRTPDEYLLCFKQDRLSRIRFRAFDGG